MALDNNQSTNKPTNSSGSLPNRPTTRENLTFPPVCATRQQPVLPPAIDQKLSELEKRAQASVNETDKDLARLAKQGDIGFFGTLVGLGKANDKETSATTALYDEQQRKLNEIKETRNALTESVNSFGKIDEQLRQGKISQQEAATRREEANKKLEAVLKQAQGLNLGIDQNALHNIQNQMARASAEYGKSETKATVGAISSGVVGATAIIAAPMLAPAATSIAAGSFTLTTAAAAATATAAGGATATITAGTTAAGAVPTSATTLGYGTATALGVGGGIGVAAVKNVTGAITDKKVNNKTTDQVVSEYSRQFKTDAGIVASVGGANLVAAGIAGIGTAVTGGVKGVSTLAKFGIAEASAIGASQVMAGSSIAMNYAQTKSNFEKQYKDAYLTPAQREAAWEQFKQAKGLTFPDIAKESLKQAGIGAAMGPIGLGGAGFRAGSSSSLARAASVVGEVGAIGAVGAAPSAYEYSQGRLTDEQFAQQAANGVATAAVATLGGQYVQQKMNQPIPAEVARVGELGRAPAPEVTVAPTPTGQKTTPKQAAAQSDTTSVNGPSGGKVAPTDTRIIQVGTQDYTISIGHDGSNKPIANLGLTSSDVSLNQLYSVMRNVEASTGFPVRSSYNETPVTFRKGMTYEQFEKANRISSVSKVAVDLPAVSQPQYYHGSSSASLSNILKNGLRPLNEQEGIPFTGELGPGTWGQNPSGNNNYNRVSVATAEHRSSAVKYSSEMQPAARGWSLEMSQRTLHEAEQNLKARGIDPSSPISPEYSLIEKSWLSQVKIETARQAQWPSLSPLEHQLIEKPFPVVYGVHYDGGAERVLGSDIPGDRFIPGVGNEALTLYVPPEYVGLVKTMARDSNSAIRDVRSLDDLK